MAKITVNGQQVTVSDNFLTLPREQQDATVDEIAKNLTPPKPEGVMANAVDAIKSIPRGLASGASKGVPGNPFVPMEDVNVEMAPIREGSRQTLINQTYEPQGTAGRITAAAAESVATPESWLGPGGPILKAGGAALSGAAGEGAAEGVEAMGGGKGAQFAARLGGAVLGGAAAAKMAGGSPKAAIPTAEELKEAATKGYTAARNSGLELDVRGPASWAARTEAELAGPNYGFTGGKDGVAPKTFGVLERLQSPPTGATITAGNLDALRKNLGNIAQELGPTGKPTADAAAATVALKSYGQYLENLPANHIVAGDAAAYLGATKQANANWGAYERTRDFDTRLTKAERATDRQIAGSLDNQIKQKAGQLLDSAKSRGLNQQERAQLELINSGGPASNTLRQLGRGGAGVIPLGTQAAIALATGGTHIVPQAALAAALYGARKGSEAITKSRANKLAEMLAQRSPEYESRLRNLPPADTAPGTAAILRALLAH